MKMEQRIDLLKRRHSELDAEIQMVQSRPYYDSIRLRDLKLRKLMLKEQIDEAKPN